MPSRLLSLALVLVALASCSDVDKGGDASSTTKSADPTDPPTSEPTTGACGCGLDSDCAGLDSDVCTDSGTCGCSSVAACTATTFDGTTLVCEPG